MNKSGEILERFVYGTYGELLSEVKNNIRFLYNGAYGVTTDENGLYYMRVRYYNPDIKRFINQDIKVGDIGSSQSLNRYAYCEGNPVSMIDPFGLCGEDAQDQGSESKYKYLHAALDILGFAFDGADLINAGIYALENDWVNAGLCLVSFIPAVGSAIVGVAKSAKAVKKLKTAEKVASFVAENGKNIRTASHMTEITHDTMKVIGECGSDTLKVVDGLSVNASYKGIRMLETGSDSAAKGAKKAIWEIQEAVGSEGIKFSTRVEESALALKKTSSKRIKSGTNSIGNIGNPSDNPKVLADAIEDSTAVYGYRPREDGSIKQFANYDWSDPKVVAELREIRLDYLQENRSYQNMVDNMRNAGCSNTEIAQRLVVERNTHRLSYYVDETGKIINEDLYRQAAEHCVSYEDLRKGINGKPAKTDLQIIESAMKSNPGYDACCGLYGH